MKLVAKRISRIFMLFALLFFTSYIAHAATGGAVEGWLWGGSTHSSMGSTGLGWISMNGSNYGVNIPETDGNVTGYAWSENVGWIDFSPSGDYPASPSHSVQREGDRLTGWARIVAHGDWEGWIKLSSESGDPVSYGVTIQSNGSLSGYGWNGEQVRGASEQYGYGWIDFSRASVPVVSSSKQLIICPPSPLSLSPGGSQQLNAFYTESETPITCDPTSGGTNVTTLAQWTSSIPSAVTVNNITTKGLIQAVGSSGSSSTITAEYNGVTTSLIVNVTASSTPTLILCPLDGVHIVGTGQGFLSAYYHPTNTITCSDLSGASLVNEPATWTSTNPGEFSVDTQDGWVRSLNDNSASAQIQATYSGSSASVPVSSSIQSTTTCWTCDTTIESCTSYMDAACLGEGVYDDADVDSCNAACAPTGNVDTQNWKEIVP